MSSILSPRSLQADKAASLMASGGVSVGRFGSGQSVKRIEDPALVRGCGKFVDDAIAPALTYACFLRSPWAHANIASMDTSTARQMPGVVAVLTGEDVKAAGLGTMPAATGFKRADGSGSATPLRPLLAIDTVRFVGEAVAMIIADTRAEARAAADAISVNYHDLPAVTDSRAAVQVAAPLVWPAAPGNLCAEMHHGDPAAAVKAFSAATHVVTLELDNQRLIPAPMEPRGALATVEEATGRLTLRLSSQMPSGARDTLCDAILHVPRDTVRVVVGDVGGGFGMKTGLYPEEAAVAWAARQLKRNIKWIAERSEEFLSAVHGRDLISRAEMALDASGRVLALRVHSLANVGAYAQPAGVAIQVLIGPWVATSIYDIGTIDLHIQAVLTHTPPTGPYRGAGRPENIYIIERLMDAAARKMGMDGAALRRLNMIRTQQMPYRNAMGQTYDTGHFELMLDQGLALADWDGFEARAAASASRGRLRGRGLASFLEWTGGNALEERVDVTVSGDGFIEIYTATQAMGQGIATSYAQLAVDVFGVSIDKIRIIQGDTDRGSGFGSAGSRSLFTAGSTLTIASRKAVDEAQSLAAQALEVGAEDLTYGEGAFRVVGTDRAVSLFDLAARQPEHRIVVDARSTAAGPSWPNGCHVCEVEVDAETGGVVVVGYASVNDVGRVINPMIVRGQLDGGVVQGLGQALCEQVVFDPQSGQLLTGSFLDYAMPRADLVGNFRTALNESVPCLNNPLGSKGVGELGTIGATPAVVNAVVDALWRAGVGERALAIQMPLTPERVWRALHGVA